MKIKERTKSQIWLQLLQKRKKAVYVFPVHTLQTRLLKNITHSAWYGISSRIVSYFFTSQLTFHVAYQPKWKSKLFKLFLWWLHDYLCVKKRVSIRLACSYSLPQSFQGSYYFSPSVRPSLFSHSLVSASILFFKLSQNKIVEKILLVHKSSSHAAYLMHSVIRQLGLKASRKLHITRFWTWILIINWYTIYRIQFKYYHLAQQYT